MRERTFRKPSVRYILSKQNIALPDRVRDYPELITDLFKGNILMPTRNSYKEAVYCVENLEEEQIALFPKKFRIPGGDSNIGIKSLDKLVKIDSIKTLRSLGGNSDIPKKLTKEFAETKGIRPYELFIETFKRLDAENPPWGFYWVGADGHSRITTPIRNVEGAEMKVMSDKSGFYGGVIDKRPYGRNLRVKVASRDNPKEIHTVHLFNLPMSKANDPRQYFLWLNTEHRSDDPDSCYRGGAHGQRVFPGFLWSAPTVFSFYEAMSFLKTDKNWNNIRINLFGIPRSEADIGFIDNLRLNSLILDEDDKGKINLKVLNKTEMDSLIVARTILRGYDKIWTHWGNKDFSFLYTPED